MEPSYMENFKLPNIKATKDIKIKGCVNTDDIGVYPLNTKKAQELAKKLNDTIRAYANIPKEKKFGIKNG